MAADNIIERSGGITVEQLFGEDIEEIIILAPDEDNAGEDVTVPGSLAPEPRRT